MKKIALLFLTLFLFSCGTQKVKVSESTVDEAKIVNRVKSLLQGNSKEQDAGVRLGKKLIAANPNSYAAIEAHDLLGDYELKRKNYAQAFSHFDEALRFNVSNQKEAELRIGAARSLNGLKKLDQASTYIEKGLSLKEVNPETLKVLHQINVIFQQEKGNRLEALQSLSLLSSLASQPQEKEAFRLRAQDLIESSLTMQELQTVANDSRYEAVRGVALYKVGYAYFEQGDFSKARSYLNAARSNLNVGLYVDRANELIQQIDSRSRVNPRIIGAILPLSGRLSVVGQKTLRGLQMGLGIYGPNANNNIQLSVIDSEGNPEIARRGVTKLVLEDSPIAIVGDVLSKTALSVASKAQDFGIPTIGLSQKSGVTQVGDYIFRNSLTNEMQIHELLNVAMGKKGFKRFAVLYPNDAYGVELANLFWDEVLARGGQITGAQSYDPKETDFRKSIKRLVGTYYIDDRAQEYQIRLRELKKDQKSHTARDQIKDVLPPIVDFDAIFIPDSTRAAGQIAAMLTYNDVNNVTLMGTNLFHSKDLVDRGGKNVEGALFIDSALPSAETNSFYQNFVRTYSYKPDIFELQGYETGLILRHALEQGASTRVALKERLSKLSQFKGVVGPLSMSGQREVLRPLVLYTVEKGVIKPL